MMLRDVGRHRAAMLIRGLLTLLMLVLAGCSGSEGQTGAERDATEDAASTSPSPSSQSSTDAPATPPTNPHLDDRVVEAVIEVEVNGALDFTWRETGPLLHLLTLTPPERELRLFSAGMAENGQLDTGERFRVGFDHVGQFDGPGHYEIEPDGATMSNVVFLVAVLHDPSGDISGDNVQEVREFTHLPEPCSIEAGDGLNSGRLHCPDVRDAAGESVELTMTWESVDT